jgi:hypothetical protein
MNTHSPGALAERYIQRDIGLVSWHSRELFTMVQSDALESVFRVQFGLNIVCYYSLHPGW